MAAVLEPFMSCADHGHCIDTALDQAEKLCLARGARLTPIRRAVLAEIWADHEATKAYDLIDRLSRDGAVIKPPTIYRALDFLLAHHLIHRIESLNAFVGCAQPDIQHQAVMMICDQCGDIREESGPEIAQQLRQLAAREGFLPTDQTIELHGLCAKCQATGPAKTNNAETAQQ